MQNKNTIRSFTDLITWQKAHVYVVNIYKTTKAFPHDEVFGLTSQLRRATVSITSNIAEGFGRESYKEKLHFYTISRGSLIESQNQLLIARDIKYIQINHFKDLSEQSIVISKLLNGLIKKTKEVIAS